MGRASSNADSTTKSTKSSTATTTNKTPIINKPKLKKVSNKLKVIPKLKKVKVKNNIVQRSSTPTNPTSSLPAPTTKINSNKGTKIKSSGQILKASKPPPSSSGGAQFKIDHLKNKLIETRPIKTSSSSKAKFNGHSGNSSTSHPSSSGHHEKSSTSHHQRGGSSSSTSTTNYMENGVLDRSQLNQPYDIKVNGFTSLSKTIQNATPKVKNILMNECDLILECKICRSLFRTLPNFISHKQAYCTKEYSSTSHVGFAQFIQNSQDEYELQYKLDSSITEALKSLESQDLSNLSNLSMHAEPLISESDRSERLAKVLSKITTSKIYNRPTSSSSSLIPSTSTASTSAVAAIRQNQAGQAKNLELILSNLRGRLDDGIVYQKCVKSDPSVCDVSNNSPTIPEHLLIHSNDENLPGNAQTAVLGPDGKLICVGAEKDVKVIVDKVLEQVEEQSKELQRKTLELKCLYCNTIFPTEKSLRNHIREAHSTVPRKASVNAGKLVKKQLARDPFHKIASSNKRFKLDPDQASSSSGKSTNEKTSSTSTTKVSSKSGKMARGKGASKASGRNSAPLKVESESDFESSNEFSDEPESHCRSCDRTFEDREELSRHIARNHGFIEDSLFTPANLPTSISSISIMERHSYTKQDSESPTKRSQSTSTSTNSTSSTTSPDEGKSKYSELIQPQTTRTLSLSADSNKVIRKNGMRSRSRTPQFNNNLNEDKIPSPAATLPLLNNKITGDEAILNVAIEKEVKVKKGDGTLKRKYIRKNLINPKKKEKINKKQLVKPEKKTRKEKTHDQLPVEKKPRKKKLNPLKNKINKPELEPEEMKQSDLVEELGLVRIEFDDENISVSESPATKKKRGRKPKSKIEPTKPEEMVRLEK